MNKQPSAMTIRTKILGVLIKNARISAGKNLEECAKILQVSNTKMEELELGMKPLSLPELEILAHYLEVPIDHFWGRELLSDRQSPSPDFDIDRLVTIRTKIIGTLLRMSRQEAGHSMESLAELVGTSPELIQSYEVGEIPLPLPLLEMIAKLLDQPIKRFQDKDGPLGKCSDIRQKTREFLELSPEVQNFVIQPLNRPYIELAQRLSEMPAQKLRTIAEGLLEITL